MAWVAGAAPGPPRLLMLFIGVINSPFEPLIDYFASASPWTLRCSAPRCAMALSLAGLAGSLCRGASYLLWVYLLALFLLIALLLVFTVFAFAVTNRGAGSIVSGRGYREYRLGEYSTWLQRRVENSENWGKIRSCLRDGKVCRELGARKETVQQFVTNDLSPIQSGCCKPPTGCNFTYQSETVWIKPPGLNSTRCQYGLGPPCLAAACGCHGGVGGGLDGALPLMEAHGAAQGRCDASCLLVCACCSWRLSRRFLRNACLKDLAIDHIINSASKSKYMPYCQINVLIVFRGPNGAADGVRAQYSQTEREGKSVTITTFSKMVSYALQVREHAAGVLASLMKGIDKDLSKDFHDRSYAQAQRILDTRRRTPKSGHPVATIHGAVLALTASVLSVPYDMPSWLPGHVTLLACFLREPSPLKSTVTKAAEFKRMLT